jgi:hypothetical protein
MLIQVLTQRTIYPTLRNGPGRGLVVALFSFVCLILTYASRLAGSPTVKDQDRRPSHIAIECTSQHPRTVSHGQRKKKTQYIPKASSVVVHRPIKHKLLLLDLRLGLATTISLSVVPAHKHDLSLSRVVSHFATILRKETIQ